MTGSALEGWIVCAPATSGAGMAKWLVCVPVIACEQSAFPT